MLATPTRRRPDPARDLHRMRAVAGGAAAVAGARTEGELFRRLRETCETVVPFDSCTFGLLGRGGSSLHVLEAVDEGVRLPRSIIELRGTPAERVLRERTPLLVTSSSDPAGFGCVPMGGGRRSESVIHVPLQAGDELLGLLSLQSYTPHFYQPADVELVEALAAIVSIALLNLRHQRELKRKARRLRDREAEMAAIFGEAGIGIVVADLDGRLMRTNPALDRMLGYEAGELAGRTIADISVDDEYGERERTLLEELRAGERESYRIDKQLVRRDGTRLWIRLTGSLVRDDQGRPAFVIGTGEDVTQERRATTALAVSEERHRALLAHSNDLLAVVDERGRVSYVSPNVERLFGYPVDDIMGREVFHLIHPAEREWARRKFQDRLRGCASTPRRDVRFRRRDGTWRVLELFATDLREHEAIGGIVFNGRDVSDRALAQAEAEKHRRRLEAAQAIADVGDWECDLALDRVMLSDHCRRILGIDPRAPVCYESVMDRLHPEDRQMARDVIGRAAREAMPYQLDFRVQRPDGVLRYVHARGYIELSEAGEALRLFGTVQDVTVHRSLENQLREAQKMEAVGQLAGGIAHDFNNLLTVIAGHVHMLLDELRPGDPMRTDVQEIERAASRAGNLTRQLLAFSRRQVLQPRVLALNGIISDVERMLRRVIGEDVKLTTDLAGDLGMVEVDPGQMEQVLMNLAVNARDAMAGGGSLRISTSNAFVDEHFAARYPYEVATGPYVRLSVSDTGSGIPDSVIDHIFEPFFTTKTEGLGTGLGLSTVYGIVKQSQGYIWARSEKGRGTTFDVYLPRTESRPAAPADEPPADAPDGGGETILLVEDDDGVRSLARRVLRRKGYTVLEARHGGEALLICERRQDDIDLVLTDVVMPQMSGVALMERLRSVKPELQPLFMSGYTENEVLRRGLVADRAPFIQKPFSPDDLASKVRQALNRDAASPPAGLG